MKSIPSVNPFPLSAICSADDIPSCFAQDVIFFICSVDDRFDLFCWQCDQFCWWRSSIGIAVVSWVSGQSVVSSRMTCWFTWHAEPNAGHRILDPLYRWARIRDRQWSAHIFIWSGQISPIRSYLERKLAGMIVPRAAQIISGSWLS